MVYSEGLRLRAKAKPSHCHCTNTVATVRAKSLATKGRFFGPSSGASIYNMHYCPCPSYDEKKSARNLKVKAENKDNRQAQLKC